MTPHLRRVYALPPERVCLERTAASADWSVTAAGLLPCGPSQAHRPDWPQVHVRRSGLAPLGLPVATDVVSGPRAAAPQYLAAIMWVRARVGPRWLLYVGVGKMAALEPRACVQAGGDHDLGPLSEVQLPPEVGAGQQPWPRITRVAATGTREHIADGDERLEPLTWTARRLVGRVGQLARAGPAALNDRGRGKPRFTERPARPEAVAASLTRYRVQGLLAVRYTDRVQERPRRRYSSRPATGRVERAVGAPTVGDRRAVAAAGSRLGWRVDASHAPPDQLPLAQAVLAYRSPYLVVSARGRLNGSPRSLTPLYLERDAQAISVIRLLAVGWRVLTLLAGLSAGHPKRATARPTTERRLTRVAGVPLTLIREGRRRRYHRTPLSRVQRSLRPLLNFPVAISTRLGPDSHQPP